MLDVGLFLTVIGVLFALPILWIMLAGTLFTAVQRFAKVWNQASAPRPAKRPDRRFQRRRTSRPAPRTTWQQRTRRLRG